jgi:hypothetical protein
VAAAWVADGSVLTTSLATGATVLVMGAAVGAGGAVDLTGTGGGTVLAALREPEPGEAELADDAAKLVAEATGATAEPTAEVTGDVAEPTAEPTTEVTDEADPTDDEAVDAVDVCFDVRGARAAVAACAGRENSSKTTKIPAATSAACIAARAMRRTTGCDMSSSTRRETGPPAYPPAAATNHARPDLLFGHHRTVLSRVGQGVRPRQMTQCGEGRQRDRRPPPPDRRKPRRPISGKGVAEIPSRLGARGSRHRICAGQGVDGY